MIIQRIDGCTRVLGKEQGYLGLPIADILVEDNVNGPATPAMETAWEPTPDELDRLNRGGLVILRVLGTEHPPVMLEVTGAPDDPVNEESE